MNMPRVKEFLDLSIEVRSETDDGEKWDINDKKCTIIVGVIIVKED